jgi:hypothetical protein
VQGQFIKKETYSAKVILGLHSNGQGFNAVHPDTGEEFKYSNVFLEPYAGYFFNKNFGIGLIAGYDFVRGNQEPHRDLFDFGIFARYYYPVKLNREVLDRLLFLSEASYRRSTYELYNDEEYFESDAFRYDYISLVPIGAEIRLFKELYFELSTEWLIYSENYNSFRYRIGFEYHLRKMEK